MPSAPWLLALLNASAPKDTLEILTATVLILTSAQLLFVAKMQFVSTSLDPMIADAKMASLEIHTRFAQLKTMKKETTFAKTPNVVPMLFATWVNACVLLASREMILTIHKLDVKLFPNVPTTQTVATMKSAQCCPTLYTGNVSMPVQEQHVDPMLIVSQTITT